MPVFIFGDESGTLVDPRDPVVAVALIISNDPDRLKPIVPRAWRRYIKRKKTRRRIEEFKFHNVEEVDRRRVIEAIGRATLDIVTLTIDKGEQQIPDTPENYGLLLAEVIEMCRAYYLDQNMTITLDRHFSQSSRQNLLVSILQDRLDLLSAPRFADSHTDSLVQLADFVAVAIHRAHRHGDSSLADLVNQQVIESRVVRWKDLKRKWVEKGINKKW